MFSAPQRLWSHFIDAVTQGCESVGNRISPPRRLTIVEEQDGRLSVLRANASSQVMGNLTFDSNNGLSGSGGEMMQAVKGARIDLVLLPDRFLIRDLPLPAQADDFLDRILRAQIDRWTPWPADRAVFGYRLREQTGDKIIVAVAAGDRKDLQPIFDAFAALKPAMLNAFAGPVDGAPRIALMQKSLVDLGGNRLRALIGGILIAVSLALLVSFAWAAWENSRLDAEYETLQSQLAGKRVGLRAEDPMKAQERLIILRKAGGPYVSVMLEELTRAMPDNTWLTDIDVTGAKLRVIGISRDATALIAKIEKSAAFSDASFFAPTTRSAQESGEQFHIEATMQPGRGDKP